MPKNKKSAIVDDNVPNPLPCRHQQRVVKQIQPTINLLQNLDTNYPDLLRQQFIEPQDYHGGLVFRSAIESIRGSYIASSTPGREQFIANTLTKMKSDGLIFDFDKLSSKERWDFEVFFDQDQSYLAVIEVKGGEGNSVNISVRSRLVKEFGIWSHLDGSIQHHPSKGARSIVNRITNELSARNKQVDMLFFKDVLCGTRARPCPKYPGREDSIGINACPDIYLFPQRVPTLQDPEPPVHTIETLRLPKLLLENHDIPPSKYQDHLWYVHLKLVRREDDAQQRLQRIFDIQYKGKSIAQGKSKLFTLTEL